MKSLWNNIEKPKFSSLQGDAVTDVLIIGGGLCGILCAHMLKESGVDCILAEADEICKKAYEKVYTCYRKEIVYDLYRSNYNKILCK